MAKIGFSTGRKTEATALPVLDMDIAAVNPVSQALPLMEISRIPPMFHEQNLLVIRSRR